MVKVTDLREISEENNNKNNYHKQYKFPNNPRCIKQRGVKQMKIINENKIPFF